jgi:hypothetical protein
MASETHVTCLDLVNVDLSILLLELLIRLLHSIEGGHRIAHVVHGERCALHIKLLLRELRNL